MELRDETRILPCGCKIGRSKEGLWYYDYICEIHLPEVLERGKYSFKKAEELTKKLNEEMKELELGHSYGLDVMIVRKEKKDEKEG